jgi:hypothetical protein
VGKNRQGAQVVGILAQRCLGLVAKPPRPGLAASQLELQRMHLAGCQQSLVDGDLDRGLDRQVSPVATLHVVLEMAVELLRAFRRVERVVGERGVPGNAGGFAVGQ